MTEHDDPIPKSYDGWRHCIEQWCGIPLTTDFVNARIQALENPGDYHTRKFIECYGEDHHRRVLGWFRQCAESLDRSA